MASPKPCPEGKVRNEKTKRCINEKKKASSKASSKASPKTSKASSKAAPAKASRKDDERAIADVAIMKDMQKQYMQLRSELAKVEEQRDKFRDAYENMVRTMAKCHEDLKQEKRRR